MTKYNVVLGEEEDAIYVKIAHDQVTALSVQLKSHFSVLGDNDILDKPFTLEIIGKLEEVKDD